MSQDVDLGGGGLPFCVIGALLVFSVIHRLVRRKPVLFFSVPGADFLDGTASGGDARNCLVVAIKAGRLIVRPFFPFNLVCLLGDDGLEFDVPLGSVLWAQLLPPRTGVRALQRAHRNVRVCVSEPGHDPRTLDLLLTDPEAFVKLLPALQPPSASHIHSPSAH